MFNLTWKISVPLCINYNPSPTLILLIPAYLLVVGVEAMQQFRQRNGVEVLQIHYFTSLVNSLSAHLMSGWSIFSIPYQYPS